MEYKVGILGAGSWGSALAIAMSQVASVTLWGRDLKHVSEINQNRINSKYIPADIVFPNDIAITADIQLALCNKDLLIIATSFAGLRDMFIQIKQACKDLIPDIIWVCKGIELDTGLFPHQIAIEELGCIDNIGALLGPSFADEVAYSLPTAITLTSSSPNFANKWINVFNNIRNFRVYANTDVIGSEVGSAVKNIMAIAVGISDGLKLGYNARAALITRSLNELGNMVIALKGQAKTIYGLTGIGDLILTCTGDLSRNRSVGMKLAQGKTCEEILSELGHVAEGVYATKEIYLLSKKLDLSMPIVEAVYSIIYNNANIKDTVNALLSRAPKFELGH